MLIEHLFVHLLNSLSRKRRSSIDSREGLLIGRVADVRGGSYLLRMPNTSRTEHMFVLGKTGTGKTHLLQQLAEQHMQHGEGFAIFDYHGDLTRALLETASRYADARERLVLIDPTDADVSPGLNPLELRRDDVREVFSRVSELTGILRARWGVEVFGPRSEELLRNVLYTLAINGLTLVEAPPLLTLAAFRKRLTSELPSADIQSYWRDRFEPLSDSMKATFREPLLNKITGLLVDPSTRHLLGQAESTIDLRAAMQNGAWVLINVSKGVLRENAFTLANLIFAKLQFEVFSRTRLPKSERRLFTIMVDEVQNLAENDLITLLTEGRKFGIGLITANQYWEQLPRPLRGALLGAGTQMFFRISHADASSLASELAASHGHHLLEQLTSLPRGHAIARIGATEPVKVTIPAGTPARDSRHEAWEALRTLSLRRYARERDDIERDIQQRLDDRQQSPSATTPHDDSTEGQLDW